MARNGHTRVRRCTPALWKPALSKLTQHLASWALGLTLGPALACATRAENAGNGRGQPAALPTRAESAPPESSRPAPPCKPVDAIEAQSVLADLELLTGVRAFESATRPDRPLHIRDRHTTVNKAAAREYLAQRFIQLGYEVREQRYGTGVNFIADRPGTSGQYLIVSAHLDTVAQTPGADDDASGIAAGLAIAQALDNCRIQHGLRFVAFDEEELGLVGSSVYAARLRNPEQVIGAIQLEMLAYDSNGDGLFNVVDCQRPESRALSQAIESAAQRQGRVTPRPGCTERSDHASFWAQGMPAIVVAEMTFGEGADPNPCYHQTCDDLEQLNLEYMLQVTQALASGVAELIDAH